MESASKKNKRKESRIQVSVTGWGCYERKGSWIQDSKAGPSVTWYIIAMQYYTTTNDRCADLYCNTEELKNIVLSERYHTRHDSIYREHPKEEHLLRQNKD